MTVIKEVTPVRDADAVQDARAAAAKQSDGLDHFQLVPKDSDGKPKYTGEALLDHMVKRRNIFKPEEVKHGPSRELDVHLMKDSLEMIAPTFNDMRRDSALRDHIGERAKRKCAKKN